MAQTFGEPGRSATDETHKRSRRFLMIGFLGIALSSAIVGYSLTAFAPVKGLPALWTLVIDCLLIIVMVLTSRWGFKQMPPFLLAGLVVGAGVEAHLVLVHLAY